MMFLDLFLQIQACLSKARDQKCVLQGVLYLYSVWQNQRCSSFRGGCIPKIPRKNAAGLDCTFRGTGARRLGNLTPNWSDILPLSSLFSLHSILSIFLCRYLRRKSLPWIKKARLKSHRAPVRENRLSRVTLSRGKIR